MIITILQYQTLIDYLTKVEVAEDMRTGYELFTWLQIPSSTIESPRQFFQKIPSKSRINETGIGYLVQRIQENV